MSKPYAFINEPMQTYMAVKSKLDLGAGAAAKFDQLNAHVRNSVVMPGQLIIVPDTSTAACTSEEAWLMLQGREVKQAMMAQGGDGFILRNYDLLQSLLGNAALGVGAATGGWSKHLDGVKKTLSDIDALHKQYLRARTSGARSEFLNKRQQFFEKLDHQLKGMGRYGSGLRNNGSIKKMLNISTRRYVNSGEIRQYSQKMKGVAKVANLLKKGTYVGWALDAGASALEVEEACSTGRREQCTKTKFVEGGKFIGGIGGGTFGGSIGSTTVVGLCISAGAVSAGAITLACAIVGGVAGGVIVGEAGKMVGEMIGSLLYKELEQ